MNQTLTLAVAALLPFTVTHDAAGNVIPAEANVLVKTSDPAVFTVDLSEDGRTAVLTGVSTGPAVLSFYDADSQDIYMSVDVTVVAAVVTEEQPVLGGAVEGDSDCGDLAASDEPAE